jgi:enoyl-CoA hydratase/carnithine racemase
MERAMSEDLVEYECSDGIATIALNRPDKLNAVNDDMVRQIAAALKRFDTDSEAHVAILCGRGRAFSTGADVRQRQMRTREEFERHGGAQAQDASSHDLLLRAVNWKPVIAAVHGYVMGLSLGLTLECDLIVAEEGTRFQVTETPRGLSGAKYWALLNFRGGGAFATDVALTGRFFTAEEARAAGVIERVAPQGELLAAARLLAADVAKNPPLGVRSTIRARRYYLEQLSREVLMQVNLAKLHLTEDFAESARAFAEKRSPRPYKGR